MEAQAVQLAQYAAFGAARLHFSRLFFQTTAFILAASLAGALLLQDLAEPVRNWCLLGAGVALTQGAFIVSRLQRQEARYETLLQVIEANFEGGLHQPTSGPFGAKTSVVLCLLGLGVLLIGYALKGIVQSN